MTSPATASSSLPAKVALTGEVTIYRVAELRQALLGALDEAQVVEVDLSLVSELDTAGVQLLLFARRVADSRAKQLLLLEPSEAVVDVFALLNLGPALGATPS